MKLNANVAHVAAIVLYVAAWLLKDLQASPDVATLLHTGTGVLATAAMAIALLSQAILGTSTPPDPVASSRGFSELGVLLRVLVAMGLVAICSFFVLRDGRALPVVALGLVAGVALLFVPRAWRWLRVAAFGALVGCSATTANAVVGAIFTVDQAACLAANQGLAGSSTAVKDFEAACDLDPVLEPAITQFVQAVEANASAKKAVSR
jgi:hypothetical protein